MFTRNSLPQTSNQSNPSLSTSSTVISSAPSIQSDSKETSTSPSVKVITTTAQNVPKSSSGTFDSTETKRTNSVAIASSLVHNAYTVTPVLPVYSSTFIIQSRSTERSRSTALTLFASTSLAVIQINASSSSSSTSISLDRSVLSSLKETNTSISIQETSTKVQTISTIAGRSPGSVESLNSMPSSLAHYSHTGAPSFVNDSSTYIRPSTATESFQNTQQDSSSRRSLVVNSPPQATSQIYTSIDTRLQTSQTNLVAHNSSTSDIIVSGSSSVTSIPYQTYTPVITRSVSFSISSNPMSDNQLFTPAIVSSSGPFIITSSPEISTKNTLQLNQTLSGSSTPSVNVQHSGSTTSSVQVPVKTTTTTTSHISSVHSSFKQTVNESYVVTSSSSQHLPNSSAVKREGLNSTMLSQVITISYSRTLLNPSSPFSSTVYALKPTETSANRASTSQLNTVVTMPYVSSFSSVDSSNSAEPFSSSRTSLPNSPLSFSNIWMATNSTSGPAATYVSTLLTKASSIFITATQETPSKSSNSSYSKHLIGNSSYSYSYSSSFQLKVNSLVSSHLPVTATSTVFSVASISSSSNKSSVSISSYDLILATQTTTVLLTPTSEYLESPTTGSSYKSIVATQDSTNFFTVMLRSTTSPRHLPSSLNVIGTTPLLSTYFVGDSSAQSSVRASSSLSGNNTFVDKVTLSSIFETATPYLSSSADGNKNGTGLSSSLPHNSTVVTISTQTSPVLGKNISIYTTGTGSIPASDNGSTFYSSQGLLHSTSKHLEASTPTISSTSRHDDTATVSNRTSVYSSVLSMNSSHLASYINHTASESSLTSTVLFRNTTASIVGSQPFSADSSTSELQQKPLTSITLTASITRTSLSVKNVTSDIRPTLAPSVTMAPSKSDSSTSELVSETVSLTFSNPRETTAAKPSYAINRSIDIQTEYSSFPSSASFSSEAKQTSASSGRLGVTLLTLAETSSRIANQSVSVHESSSYLHVTSSKFNKPKTNMQINNYIYK